jgi:hypothetical protein
MAAHLARILLMAGVVGTASAALAQTPVQPQPRDPNMPSPHRTVPDKIEGGPGDTTGSTGTLSDRLEKSDGVIRPPVEGGGRTITPPDTGTTPVIPPPGSPGSRAPNAEPK